jgi:hypothetical protein
MKDLVKKILREEFGDDLDWIRQINPNTPINFYGVQTGGFYEFEPTQHFFDTIENCGGDVDMFYPFKMVEVLRIGENQRSTIYCDGSDGYVDTHYLRFYDYDNQVLDTFYVTEDMVGEYYRVDYSLNESTDDWDWVREHEFTLAPGDLFTEDDICFNYGTDCTVNVDSDFIIFYLDYDKWIKMSGGISDGDGYYLKSLINYGESVSDRYYSDYNLDQDEFNYSSRWMLDEQREKLINLMSQVNPNFDGEDIIDNDNMLRIGDILKPFPEMESHFDNLVYDFVSQIEENQERNRWKSIYNDYATILLNLEVELETYGNDIRIDVPMITVDKLGASDLSDILLKVSDKFLEVPWEEWYYANFDSSGGEDNITDYFNNFLDKLESFVENDESLIDFKNFSEKIEKLGFEQYQEYGFKKIFALENDETSFWRIDFIEDEDGEFNYKKVKLRFMEGNLNNYTSAEEIESFIIPISEIPVYISNYRLRLESTR